MIFVLDIGNTNIKAGVYEGHKLIKSWRMATDWHKTSDEYGILMMELFAFNQLDPKGIKGVIFSSVVPSINHTIEHMIEDFFHIKPWVVGPGIKTGINIRYENPREVGSDRIVNAVAAYELYGGPCIIIDFGTATSFGAVSHAGEFLGGVICPGIKVSMDALVQRTAKLPTVELVKPDAVINRSTIANMQSGIIYGYVGQVDYIVRKMTAELGGAKPCVVATGGMAYLLFDELDVIDLINPMLTLEGLYMVYRRNEDKTA